MKLEPPASHQVRAAEGWMELGNFAEAAAELDLIEPELQDHPDVLEMRWPICAREKDWEKCVAVGAALVKSAPTRPFGWVHRSYALRRAAGGGLKIAYDSLLPAAEKFPRIWLIPYNLACYECQMGNLIAAQGWLAKATARGELKTIKNMALGDPDLDPLRSWINQM